MGEKGVEKRRKEKEKINLVPQALALDGYFTPRSYCFMNLKAICLQSTDTYICTCMYLVIQT